MKIASYSILAQGNLWVLYPKHGCNDVYYIKHVCCDLEWFINCLYKVADPQLSYDVNIFGLYFERIC